MEDVNKLGVGKEQERKVLAPKKVKVVDVSVRDKQEKDVKPLLLLTVVHEDSEQPIQVGKVKFQREDKLVVQGLWITKDEEGQISYNSALAHLMRFYDVKTVEEFKGRELETSQVSKEELYLCFKAYN